jgi:hypothetical protein
VPARRPYGLPKRYSSAHFGPHIPAKSTVGALLKSTFRTVSLKPSENPEVGQGRHRMRPRRSIFTPFWSLRDASFRLRHIALDPFQTVSLVSWVNKGRCLRPSPRCPYSRTTRTGQCACRTTESDTLPIKALLIPPWPLLPSTISPAPISSASPTTSGATRPSIRCP